MKNTKQILLGMLLLVLYNACTNISPPVEPPETPTEVEVDSVTYNWHCSSIESSEFGANRAVAVLGKFWETGQVLVVRFMGGTEAQRKWPMLAMEKISKEANLKFKVVESGFADCRVSFNTGDGAWSYVGTSATSIPQERATTNLGWQGLDVALHELMHFIGFAHEQSNPVGGICWNKPAVYKALAAPPNNWSKSVVDRNVFAVYGEHQVNATPFDAVSIMQYQIPASWTCTNIGIPGGKVLSASDRFMLGHIYPGQAPPPPPPPPPDGVTLSKEQVIKLALQATLAARAAREAGIAADTLQAALKRAGVQ